MAQLSKLEKKVLKDLVAELKKIKKSYDTHSDSVEDLLCEQITVDSNEPQTLNAAMEHIKLAGDSLNNIFQNLDLIDDHFLGSEK